MRIATSLLVLSLAIAPTGCKKKPAQNGAGSNEAGSGSAMAGSNEMGSAGSNEMGSGSAMAGSAGSNEMGSGEAGSGSAAMMGSGAGSAEAVAMAHKAGNCPSTVWGAKTTDAVKGKEVVLTITADKPDEIKTIQKRADELLKHPTKATGEAHDQKGTHGGTIGLCPLHVPEGATAKAKHEKKGVMVAITPKDNPEGLKADIDARIQRANQWVSENLKPGDKGNMGGVGGGKGDDGSNHSGKGDSHGKARKGGGKGTGGGTGGGTGK
ncbi:MAG TPA: hypothetical protein VFY79_03210 [Dehalococcoidia bacterium]|nr:hypothetical protein [Dehalococcoidia bacterium]